MIEFLSLFLGLVVGAQPVELAGEAATVELRLDGEIVDVLDEPPWIFDCDFGEPLLPHELLAIARDAEGSELGRARQWLNLPRARAEARLALLWGEGETPRAGRLVWQALDYDAPRQVAISFDGRPLTPEDPKSFELPPHSIRQLHLLRAELVFSESVQAYAELVFGGSFGDEVSTELTAVPVVTEHRKLPRPEEMQGWFRRRGRPLQVVSIDRRPAEILVVRERSSATLSNLRRLAAQRRAGRSIPRGLERGDSLRFVHPRLDSRQGEQMRYDRMPMSDDLASLDWDLYGAIAEASIETEEPAAALPIADAVAIAGLVAAGGRGPRAVILVHTGDSEDVSRFAVENVRAYLHSLRVPLYVWRPSPEAVPGGWAGAADVSARPKLAEEVRLLRKALSSQAVVWIEGSHLPNEIELTAAAKGLKLAG